MTPDELRAFEREIADVWETGVIRGPVHLAGGNEDALVEIFKEIRRTDWVFSTWRSSYHALLHGVPPELVMADILRGKSMFLHYPEYRFFTSSIVGGILPIACGVAAALKERADLPGNGYARYEPKVWCFVGDMTASIGAFADAVKFSMGHNLPIRFCVEDNKLSTNTPTLGTWQPPDVRGSAFNTSLVRKYKYQRTYPHVGSGVFVPF